MNGDFTMMMVKSIAALALVLALFALLVWALKRLQGAHLPRQQQGGALHIMQRLSLDAQHSVVEVSRGNSRYILALSQGHITLIEHIHEDNTEASQEDYDVV